MSDPKLIKDVLDVVVRNMLDEWRRSRGVIVTELELGDLPMPRSGMTHAELLKYFDLQSKQGRPGRRSQHGRA